MTIVSQFRAEILKISVRCQIWFSHVSLNGLLPYVILMFCWACILV